MHDIRDLKKNKDKYLKLLKRKNFSEFSDIDFILEKYDEYLLNLKKEEELRNDLKSLSSKIKVDPSLKEDAKKISNNIKEISKKVDLLKNEYLEKLSYIPNIPFEDVVIGKDEKDNVVIREFNFDNGLKFKNKKPHWEIISDKKLLLEEEARVMSGARHNIFGQKLSLLIKSLEMMMIENNINNGYEFLEVPLLVNERMLYNTSNLPKFENDLYKVGDNQYLIPTGEVPLTNIVANKILSSSELPINLTTSTSCFRKEAGSAGRDTRGLIRMHQFRKVEIVKIGLPDDYENDFNDLLKTSMKILEDLKLSFRIVELCTGDLSFGSKKTYDLEVYMPSSNSYREISSISIMGDFQARRMNSRVKLEDGNKIIPFTYNGSSLAIERTIAAIIENYTNENGDIIIPDILVEKMGIDKI